MSYADEIRRYCKENIIDPARSLGEKNISIKAGDIHAVMKYKNRMPLVCAALITKKFEEMAGVERIKVSGPAIGADTTFTFRIK